MRTIVNKSPRSRWTQALFLGLVCGLAHCGDSGTSDGGKKRPPPAEPPPEETPTDLGLTTDVNVEGLSYATPFLASCMRSSGSPVLPGAGKIVYDGTFGDWPEGRLIVADPLGDAAPGTDIGALLLARKGADLVVGIVAQPKAGVALDIELGGGLVRGGKWTSEVRALFRIEGTAISKWRGRSFVPVDTDLAEVALGSEGVEIHLSAEILGDAATWPTWWIRAMTAEEGVVRDRTSALYLPSMLGTDDPPVVLGGCLRWSGQATPVTFQYLRDSDAAATASFPINLVSERAFQIARLAFDATLETLGRPELPLAQIPLLATSHALAGPTKDPRPAEGGVAFRGLMLDVSRLGPKSPDPFPHGPIFEAVVTYLLDLHLDASYPGSPAYLRTAVRTRLLDEIVRRELGLSYWLDRYRPSVLPFTEQPDTDAPETLGQRQAKLVAGGPFPGTKEDFAKVSAAKAVAFGHLLGRDLDAATIVRAWQALATARPADAAVAERDFLVHIQNLMDKRPDHERAAVEKLWQGWLVAGAYDDSQSPVLAGDADLDGLPGWYELQRSTDPERADTDGDGWTDLAELLLDSDPGAATRRPGVLTPDGDFNDWLELLPKRVTLDVGAQGGCPKAADITHYAAVANDEELLIGAFARDFFEEEPKARWEAAIDLRKDERQLVITATAGSYQYEIREGSSREVIHVHTRAMPMGRGVVEWTLNQRSLGLKSPLNEPGDVKIRLRTVFEDGDTSRFCDETAWFQPFVRQ